MKSKLILLALAALVIGASLAVAAAPLGGGESSSANEETARGIHSLAKPLAASRLSASPPKGCTNLKLTQSARAELARVPVKGSTYYGACNGRRWWMTRFPDGTDGVFKAGSSTAVRIGSIAEAKCEVPNRLLELWRQADDCTAAPPVEQPDADPPKPRQDRCEVAEVRVPNYNPVDSVPDQRLPRPEELLPPRSECPELYEGQTSNPEPDGQRRYPNGRTWIEQYNWCQVMRAQGVPCTVPPPP